MPHSSTPPSDEALCLLAAQGDSSAEEELILRYRRTVLICSRSYFLMGGDNEDLVQEGMIGLLKAIRFYSPSKNTQFRTFADRCINHALISAVTSAARGKHLPLNNSLPLQDPLSGDGADYPSPTGIEASTNPEELYINREAFQEQLSAVRHRLSPMERQVLGYYLQGLTYSEIAREVGCPVKSADNAVQRVRRKLSQGG